MIKLFFLLISLALISAIDISHLRRKSFLFSSKDNVLDKDAYKGITAFKSGGELVRYLPLLTMPGVVEANYVEIKDKIKEFVGVPSKSLILIDAGGSGTRLYIFTDKISSVLVVKVGVLSTEKDPGKMAQVANLVKAAQGINQGSVLALATAGARLANNDGKMGAHLTDLVCGKGDNKIVKCQAQVMPGQIEGALGFTDGSYSLGGHSVDKKGCYIEFGSTSSQFAFVSGDKIWALSGVRSGLTPTDKSHEIAECDASKSGKSIDWVKKCHEKVVTSKIFDTDLKKCLEDGQKAMKVKCDKLMIRVNKFVMKKVKAGMQLQDGCHDVKTERGANFNCVGATGMRAIVTGLGLESLLTDTTMVELTSEEVEWVWGLYKLLNKGLNQIDEFVKVSQKDVSDCGLTSIKA